MRSILISLISVLSLSAWAGEWQNKPILCLEKQEILDKPLNIYDICPDTVATDMSKGLWEEWPKLKASEVAEAVRYCFESTFNVNKIVIQKNAK